MTGMPLLTILIAIPLIAAAIALFLNANGARWVALIATLLDFALSIYLWQAYDPNGPLPALGSGYTKAVHFLCYELGRHAGFNAVFADGSDRFLRIPAEEQSLRALITRNGGERVDPSGLE